MIKKVFTLFIIILSFLALFGCYNTVMSQAAYYNIEDFGAKAIGIDSNYDNTGAFVAAANQAALTQGYVFVPQKSYKITSTLPLKSGVKYIGEGANSQILIDASFNAGAYFPSNEGAIINESFKEVYDSATADDISIEGLTIHLISVNPGKIKTSVMLGNCKAIAIKGCSFIVEGSGEANNLDLHTTWKNAVITQNTFSNNSGPNSGGCLWVRNRNSSPQEAVNTCENAQITQNSFITSTVDEAVSIWGNGGKLKNVTFNDNLLSYNSFAGGTLSVGFTVAGNFEESETSGVEAINILNNEFNVQSFTGLFIKIGDSSVNLAPVKDVLFEGNKINLTQALNLPSQQLIYTFCNSKSANITINNNIINNTSQNKLNNGIYLSGSGTGCAITDNNISGAMDYGIQADNQGTVIVGNNINIPNGVAIRGGSNISSNTIKTSKAGIEITKQNSEVICANNVVTLDKNSSNTIIGIRIDGTDTIASCSQNSFNTNDAGETVKKCIFISTRGQFKLYNNKNYIPLQSYDNYLYAPGRVIEMSGNLIKGTVYDNLLPYNTNPCGGSWNFAYSAPMGYTVAIANSNYCYTKVSNSYPFWKYGLKQ